MCIFAFVDVGMMCQFTAELRIATRVERYENVEPICGTELLVVTQSMSQHLSHTLLILACSGSCHGIVER